MQPGRRSCLRPFSNLGHYFGKRLHAFLFSGFISHIACFFWCPEKVLKELHNVLFVTMKELYVFKFVCQIKNSIYLRIKYYVV